MKNNRRGPAVSSTRLLGVVHPAYTLSEIWRRMTWADWKREGGCGLSGQSSGMVCQKLGKLESSTLGEIADAWAPAGRELARYAETRMKTPNNKVSGPEPAAKGTP